MYYDLIFCQKAVSNLFVFIPGHPVLVISGKILQFFQGEPGLLSNLMVPIKLAFPVKPILAA